MKYPHEQLYPLLFDSLSEGVFTVDPDFRITTFNSAAEQIVGISRDAAIGRKCYEVFRADICQGGCAVKNTLDTGEPQRNVRVDILNAEMESVPVCVSTSVLRGSDGKMLGAVEIFSDLREMEALRRELKDSRSLGDLVGASPAMKDLFRLIPDVAASEATVLVEGASGTGKELVARALHDLSSRRDRPFVVLNCGALPDTLLESELFGHLKGAFTDARRDRAGLLADAEGGTLFLDEIGDTSPAFQVKLLRVLQEGEFRPLGSGAIRKADVRILAATNRDLGRLVREGIFREDLYYRLRVIPLHIPPLRERRQDIPLLVEHFMALLRARSDKAIEEISSQALAALYDYDYPGNVRELENALERAFVLCHGRRIERRHLPDELLRPAAGAVSPAGRRLRPSERTILHTEIQSADPRRESPEARQLRSVLDAHNWNRTATARALGIGRNTLWRRMKEYGLLERP